MIHYIVTCTHYSFFFLSCEIKICLYQELIDLRFDPTFKQKVSLTSFMNFGRRQKTPRSGTKGFIIHSTTNSINIGIFVLVLFAPEFPQGLSERVQVNTELMVGFCRKLREHKYCSATILGYSERQENYLTTLIPRQF